MQSQKTPTVHEGGEQIELQVLVDRAKEFARKIGIHPSGTMILSL